MQAPRKIKKKAVRFLRWTEKYTKTDMVYLTKNGFWVSVGYSIEIVAGLIVTVVLANLIPKSVLGTYQFVLSTVLILGAFTLTGINSALLRAVAQGHDGLLWNSIKIKLKWNTGIVITSGIVAIYYFFIGNSVLGTCFLIAGSTAPLIESFGLYQFYLQGKQQFRLNAFIALIRRFLPTLGIVSAAFITTNPVLLILTYYVTNLISITIALRLTLNLDKSFNPVNTNIVTYSKHLSVMNSFGKVANHIDKVLIFNFLGPVAVASFTIAQLPTKYTSNGINLLSSLILPKLATRDFPTLKNTLPRKVLLFFILTSFVVFGYILFAPTVFKIIFPAYPESVLVSQILAVALLFLPRSAFQDTLVAHAKTTPLYISRISIPTLKIVLLLILLPIYGIWGAVAAILISTCIAAILSSFLFYRTE